MSIQNKFTAKPLIELVFASVFWGFGFVATIWCFDFLSVPAILFYRFGIAGALGITILLVRRTKWADCWHEIRLSFVAAFLLAGTLILQTYGLAGTSATKAAFITTTYVVLVPVIGHFLHIEKISWRHWVCVGLAVLGAFFTLNISLNGWSLAELLTCLNALVAATHILWVGRYAPHSKSPMAFNTFQALFVALWILPFYFWTDHWDLRSLDARGAFSMLSLSVGSSFLAFMMQIRAQKHLSPSVASVLFLLESPFSFLFSFVFLGEKLGSLQMGGIILILLACLGSIFASPSNPPLLIAKE